VLKHAAVEIIQRLSAVVREWRIYFEEFGVPRAECDKISSAFRKPQAIGLREVEKA